MDLPGQSELRTVRFLVMRTRRWQSRGTNAEIWGRFRGAGNSRVGSTLTFGGTDFAPGFASVSTMNFWYTEELWQLHFAVVST